MTAVMVDTNVFVYAEDDRDLRKRGVARDLVGELELRHLGVVTTQVLAEYFHAVRYRLPRPLEVESAVAGLERLADTMRVLDMRVSVIFEAVRGVRRYHLSYYDAQIWASARLAGIELILSEDFDSGAEIEGVRFLDPFAPGFSLEEALAG